MDILLVPIPCFSKSMAVEAYYFRYLKGNNLLLESKPAGHLDGAMNSPLLETFRMVGVEPFAMDKPIFVPISAYMLLGDLASQCPDPYRKIIFLISSDVRPNDDFLASIAALKKKGFRFAIHKIYDFAAYAPIIAQCEYLFIDQKSMAASFDESILPKFFPRLKLAATHIDTIQRYDYLVTRAFSLYEGRFYRVPLTKGKADVKPLKVNLIRLINTVNDREFEFSEIVATVERDTSLSVSLMRLVNSPYIGVNNKIKTLSHAVAVLGESEVRKWVTTSVSRSLGADKPDEVTRLSLIRAKFAENLASFMQLEEQKQGLFLMGLFSVLDVMLELSMSDALEMVRVDDDIRDALVDLKGPYVPVLKFIYYYESADWVAVSREIIVHDITVSVIYDAYINATLWYKDLIEEGERRPSAMSFY